jgi:hypothetical protein
VDNLRLGIGRAVAVFGLQLDLDASAGNLAQVLDERRWPVGIQAVGVGLALEGGQGQDDGVPSGLVGSLGGLAGGGHGQDDDGDDRAGRDPPGWVHGSLPLVGTSLWLMSMTWTLEAARPATNRASSGPQCG